VIPVRGRIDFPSLVFTQVNTAKNKFITDRIWGQPNKFLFSEYIITSHPAVKIQKYIVM
jgi:hypothetical protein